MVTIEFRHIALFAHQAVGCWVVFPSGGHNLTYRIGNAEPKEMVGEYHIVMQGPAGPVTDSVGRARQRVPNLIKVAKRRLQLMPVDQLLRTGTAQAALWLPGGAIEGLEPKDHGGNLGPYGQAEWTLGTERSHLTNTVRWTAPAGAEILLRDANDDDTPIDGPMVIANTDHPGGGYGSEGDRVTLPDFDLLFRLVAPQLTPNEVTALRPRTGKLAQPDKATPYTPLCPPADL